MDIKILEAELRNLKQNPEALREPYRSSEIHSLECEIARLRALEVSTATDKK